MSRIPCNVNKDLLPLYVDDVCSEESKNMVEEHLAGCGKCREYYSALKEGIPEEEILEEKEGLLSEEKMREAAVSVIKAAKKEIFKNQTCKIAGIVAAILLTLFVLEGLDGSYMGGWLEKIPIFDIRLKVDDVRVTEMYQLASGDIYITVEPEKKCTMYYVSNLQEIYNEKDGFTGEFEGFFALESTLLDMDSDAIKSCSFVFPLSREVTEYDGTVRKREDSVIYLEGKGGKRIKVWEKGQEVEKATPEIEGEARKALEVEDERAREDLRSERVTPEEAAGYVGHVTVY